MSSSRGGDGLSRAPPHWSIHKKAADNRSGEGGLPVCICTVHGAGDNADDDPDGALLVSRRGKRVK